jgi:peptidoglycan/LPS O-acetylase OafA/YrhL
VGLLTLAGLLVALGTLPVTWLEDLTAPLGRVGYVLAGLLAAAVVAIASCDADLLAGGRTGIGRVLSVVGARAYGLYMYHLPALWIVVEIRFRLFDDPQATWLYGPELVAYVVVLWALVEANYRWIEQPAIRWAARRAMAVR